VELLVVIAIIAVLISILLPSLSRARAAAARVACSANMHQVVLAIQNYASNNKGRLPILNKMVNGKENAFTPANLRSGSVLSDLQSAGFLPGGKKVVDALIYDPGMNSDVIDAGTSGHYYYNPHPGDETIPLPVAAPGTGVAFSWPKPKRRWSALGQIPKGRILGCDVIYGPGGTAHRGSGKTEIGFWNLAFSDGSVHTVQSSDLMTRFLTPISKLKPGGATSVTTWAQLNDAIRTLELVDQGIDPKKVGSLDGTTYAWEPVTGPQAPNMYYPPCSPGSPADDVQH
jgi:type II secretory pathway pseudopilin PulG